MNNINLNLPSHDIIALIPAHNEEETIKIVIKKILKQNIFPLVVDDGSTDRTYEIALNSGAEVIRNEINKGKGEAIKSGLKYIKKNFDYRCVILIDADMQYHPEEAKILVDPILKGQAKVVKGNRNLDKLPFRHRLGNEVWKFLYNGFFDRKIKDPCCGFMAMSKEVIENINLNKIYGGYIVDSSLLIEVDQNGFKDDIDQREVSVEYKKISPIVRGIRMVLGVSWFIFANGLKRKLGIEN
jgi:glycosyltransferase involved in cell wall biosynthesis